MLRLRAYKRRVARDEHRVFLTRKSMWQQRVKQNMKNQLNTWESRFLAPTLQEHEQREPGQPQADRAEVFGMRLKVMRDSGGVRAIESGNKVIGSDDDCCQRTHLMMVVVNKPSQMCSACGSR